MANSICFISRHAHFVFLGNTRENIGGAELQQVILAKALRDRGWRVSFITERVGDGTPRIIDGIKFIAAVEYDKGNRFIRRLFTISVQLWKLMKLANAQIYYQRNPGPFSSLIGIFCRLKGRRFILAGANDANFDRGHELNVNSQLDILEIKLGFQLAHSIILQNERQSYLLKKNYGRDGVIFYNLYDPPHSHRQAVLPTNKQASQKFLWVGRLAQQKRPKLCLDLAKLLPDIKIIMVGARTSQVQLGEKVTIAAESIPNLSFLGHLPIDKVEELFDSAQGLINTSFVEGFPNTFLQAWSRGLPVFSFVDPNNLIKEHSLGVQVSSIEQMADAIYETLNDKVSFYRRSEKIRSFFENHFSTSRHIQSFEHLLLDDLTDSSS